LDAGLYTTDFQTAIDIFALGALAKAPGKPAAFAIYAEGFDEMRGLGIPYNSGLWWRKMPSEYVSRYDYLVAPIETYEYAIQIEFNPRACSTLIVCGG
jgi:hypothetical protein